MNIVTTDWRALSLPEQIRHLEVEGYVVLPDALTPEQLEQLRAETARLPTQHSTAVTMTGRGTPLVNPSGMDVLWVNSLPIRRSLNFWSA